MCSFIYQFQQLTIQIEKLENYRRYLPNIEYSLLTFADTKQLLIRAHLIGHAGKV
jgi:hypothetical protein